MAKRKQAARCRWVGLRDALRPFVLNAAGHQGSEHIRPLHWYVACRLVIEGGFRPDEITPRPPLEMTRAGSRWVLSHDEATGGAGERVVLGGLKTKNVDVVVVKDGIGPVIAVSMKGTLGAFRNLTNRMEEAVGDCTNLHIAYPALVYGFLHVLRATRQGPGVKPSDTAITSDGDAVTSIVRYHEVMARLAGRDDVRAATSRYEAVALTLVSPERRTLGEMLPEFPAATSLLHPSRFFETLYREYDQRFVYAAPALKSLTKRLIWDEASPVLKDARLSEYTPRVGDADEDDDEDASDP